MDRLLSAMLASVIPYYIRDGHKYAVMWHILLTFTLHNFEPPPPKTVGKHDLLIGELSHHLPQLLLILSLSLQGKTGWDHK